MGPSVPPGYSPPFQVVDDLHHGAWLIIVAALGLVLSLVSFLIRLYVRVALHPPFGKDDYVLLGATVLLPRSLNEYNKLIDSIGHCRYPSNAAVRGVCKGARDLD